MIKVVIERTALTAACVALLVAGGGAQSADKPLRAGRTGQLVEPPRFENYTVTEQFKGRPAAVRLTTVEARRYRTAIREGADKGPNFAGHFAIAKWGCGAGCVQFAIVDAKTGVVFIPPFYVGPRSMSEGASGDPEDPLQFRIDSRLLIINGSRNEKGEGIYYYVWNGKRLVQVKRSPINKGPR